MQVTFTSKEFYRRLRPVLTAFYVDRLVEAYAKGKLVAYNPSVGAIQSQAMSLSSFRTKVESAFKQPSFVQAVQPPSPEVFQDTFSSFELSYAVHFGAFNDSDILWSLSSLLSMPHVSKHLRDFEVTFRSYRPTEDGEPFSVTPSNEWRRAFTTTLAHASTDSDPEGIRMLLWGENEILQGDKPEAFVGFPLTFPSLFTHGCINNLSLSGSILSLLGPSTINSFLQYSSNALTHLNLGHCNSFSTKQWASMMHRCQLPFLQNLSIHDASVPLEALTSFCLLNPSITSAEIRMSAQSAFRSGSQLEMRSEDRPRFLPRLRELTATTDFLLALFNCTAGGAELEIPFFNLESLHIVVDLPRNALEAGTVNYNDVTKILGRIPAPDKDAGCKSLIALRSIELELPYNRPATELWLESASAVKGVTSMRSDDQRGIISSLFHAASDFIQSPPPSTPDLAHALSLLTHIPAFHLRLREANDWTGAPPTYALHPYTIVGFISALPGLETVVLEGVFGRPREAVSGAEEFWGGLASVWGACSNLRTLEIRGLGGSEAPAVWNRGENEPTPGITAWNPVLFA